MPEKGFTIIEVIFVIVILTILGTVAIANFIPWQRKIEVGNTIQELANVLKLAQSRTLSSENSSQYGVYLNTAPSPNQYVLFKGVSYVARDVSADQTYSLSKTTEIINISLNGGNEIVFSKLTGTSGQSGSFAVRSKTDNNESKTIYIATSGIINFESVLTGSDDSRIKDSRHIHFDYSRIIDTTTENMTLNFDNGTIIYSFPINAYLTNGVIDWTQTISVGGSNQTVRIYTHRLNSPDTKFSIYRDRRVNTKSLKISISGDTSGNILEYTSDGLTTNHPSIYVSNFNWQ